jgi:hypothetical protein
MASNTCPKCGAEIDEPKINRTPYRCRSVKWADDEFDQSDFCRARCELAAAKKDLDTLRTRHQRLVEAVEAAEVKPSKAAITAAETAVKAAWTAHEAFLNWAVKNPPSENDGPKELAEKAEYYDVFARLTKVWKYVESGHPEVSAWEGPKGLCLIHRAGDTPFVFVEWGPQYAINYAGYRRQQLLWAGEALGRCKEWEKACDLHAKYRRLHGGTHAVRFLVSRGIGLEVARAVAG